MSGVRALIDKALLGPSSGEEDDASPEEDFAGVPAWGSPARAEPSSAYIRRVRGFAERMAREVEREGGAAEGGTSSSRGLRGAENLSARFQRAGRRG